MLFGRGIAVERGGAWGVHGRWRSWGVMTLVGPGDQAHGERTAPETKGEGVFHECKCW